MCVHAHLNQAIGNKLMIELEDLSNLSIHAQKEYRIIDQSVFDSATTGGGGVIQILL